MLAVVLGTLALLSCGQPSSSRPSPTPRVTTSASATATASAPVTPLPSKTPTPSAVPTSTPRPTPPPAGIRPGSSAYVAVTVATLWRNPGAVRSVDAPALANPVRLRDWINAMTWSQKADLIGRADSQVLLGGRVLVLALSAGWAEVAVPDQPTPLDARGYPGWIPVVQLNAVAPAASATVASVVSNAAWLHEANGSSVEVSFGTRLPLVARNAGTLTVGLPGGRTGTLAQADVAISTAGTLPATAASVIASAQQFLGLPYLWAGTSAFGFDCSGLVYTVYALHGVRLPRDADAQASAGRNVAPAALLPGDLIFFGRTLSTVHHVAIYVGSGNILESPQTGYPVRIIPLSSYNDYFTARRVIG